MAPRLTYPLPSYVITSLLQSVFSKWNIIQNQPMISGWECFLQLYIFFSTNIYK